jgi:hypothetical protein
MAANLDPLLKFCNSLVGKKSKKQREREKISDKGSEVGLRNLRM